MSISALASEPLATLAKQPKPHVRTAVAGVTGYAGAELARLLLNHPRLSETPPLSSLAAWALRRTRTTIYDLHPQLARNDGKPAPPVLPFTWETLRDSGTEILFLALPHEQSREYVPEALAAGLRVIDLSGAWRLHDPANAAVYKLTDADPALAAALQKRKPCTAAPSCIAMRSPVRDLIANPGCYSTSIILALTPLVRAGLVDVEHGIICDAKSGVSGAGKAATAKTHFMYAADNLSAYCGLRASAHGRAAGAAWGCLLTTSSSRRICCRSRAASCQRSTCGCAIRQMQPRSKP